MYNKVHPAIVKLEQTRKQSLGYLYFSQSYYILVFEIAIMSKLMIVDLIKYFIYLKFLFKEQVLMRNRKRQLFLLGIFIGLNL